MRETVNVEVAGVRSHVTRIFALAGEERNCRRYTSTERATRSERR